MTHMILPHATINLLFLFMGYDIMIITFFRK